MSDSPIAVLDAAFEELRQANRALEYRLEESLAQKMLALEDIGWEPVYGKKNEDRGLTLENLHEVTPRLRDMAATNPLHKRGAQLRHAYVFGRGIEFSGLKPKTQEAVDNLYNQAALFSVQAYETNNLEKFVAGNFFVIRNESTNQCTVVPVEEITAEVTDPDDNAVVRYFMRTWSSVDANGKAVTKRRWYPVSRFKRTQIGRGKRGKIQKTIRVGGENIPVDQGAVIYHEVTQRQAGWTYGVPDSLAAMVWSLAYSEYLQDNAKLVKALQMIAWAITSSTKAGANTAAVQVASPGVGGTASMGSGNSLSSVGVPSAQVNMGNGQPLAAMVATSLGVPVIALLSSPGATGGSYGAATTLDLPTVKGMKAIQDSWKLFFKEILADMGSPDAEVTFPSLEQDATYREVQSIIEAKAAGLLHQDEAREAILNLIDAPRFHEEPPEDNPDYQAPAQGVQGTVPGGFNQDTTDSGQNDEQSE